MEATIREKLSTCSTATITTILFRRGFRNRFLQGPQLLNPAAPRMVGPAFTLRYIPSREDIDEPSVFRDRSHPQRKGVEECPEGAVFVIDSRGDWRAASAGGNLITRLMMRKVAGVVTDGAFRDSPDIARLPFPAYHARPSAPTNLILHHAADLNLPIGCGGVVVYPGDIMVGDQEGVVCIPAEIAGEVADEAVELTVYESFVQQELLKGHPLYGLYPMTDETTAARFAQWKAAREPSS